MRPCLVGRTHVILLCTTTPRRSCPSASSPRTGGLTGRTCATPRQSLLVTDAGKSSIWLRVCFYHANFRFHESICPGRYFAESSLFMVVSTVLHTLNISAPIGRDGKPILPSGKMVTGLLS